MDGACEQGGYCLYKLIGLSMTWHTLSVSTFTFTYPLTAGVVGAPQMTSRPVSSIFLCSPLPSGTWRIPGLLSSHLFLCLSWLFKFSYCQTSHSLRMTVAAMLYFVAVFVNCPLFAPVEGATTQMSLFPNTGLTAVSVT